MRNIPRYEEYLALLIEFDYEDFTDVRTGYGGKVNPHVCAWNPGGIAMSHLGAVCGVVQFCARIVVAFRRREIIQLIHHLGYDSIGQLASAHPWVSGCMSC